MKTILRSIQTFFPYLHDIRFSIKFIIIKITKKPHEQDFKALSLFQPSPDQVLVDIGSNRGEAIASMLIQSKLQNRIIGFEPNPLIFTKLNNYVRKNSRVKVYNCGLGNSNQIQKLFVPCYRKWIFDGLSSFYYESAESWLKNRMWRFDEKKLSIREVYCQMKKLDDFNLNPYFIKIDVEGYELEVLKGGSNTIRTYTPILLVENVTKDIIDLLAGINYQLYYFKKGKFFQGKGNLNTFCMTQEKYTQLSEVR